MFPTRRLKVESPYFSKIVMRARPRAPPRANFRYRAPEKWKSKKIDFFWSLEISGVRARQSARAPTFSENPMSQLYNAVSHVCSRHLVIFKNAFKINIFWKNRPFSKNQLFQKSFSVLCINRGYPWCFLCFSREMFWLTLFFLLFSLKQKCWRNSDWSFRMKVMRGNL